MGWKQPVGPAVKLRSAPENTSVGASSQLDAHQHATRPGPSPPHLRQLVAHQADGYKVLAGVRQPGGLGSSVQECQVLFLPCLPLQSIAWDRVRGWAAVTCEASWYPGARHRSPSACGGYS